MYSTHTKLLKQLTYKHAQCFGELVCTPQRLPKRRKRTCTMHYYVVSHAFIEGIVNVNIKGTIFTRELVFLPGDLHLVV